MTVPFIFRKNHLTKREDDYVAKPVPLDSLNQMDIVKNIAATQSTLNETDILITVQAYEAAIAKAITQGHNIVTPMCNISLSIKGVFDREIQEFDPKLHKVNLNFRAGVDFKMIPKQIKLVKIATADVMPVVEFFEDTQTNTKNKIITPGKAGTIRGSKLKVNAEDPDEGIFLVATDETSTKVDKYIRNKPSEVIFMLPEELATGQYHLQVRSKMEGQSLRIGELDFVLSVN